MIVVKFIQIVIALNRCYESFVNNGKKVIILFPLYINHMISTLRFSIERDVMLKTFLYKVALKRYFTDKCSKEYILKILL